MTRLSIVFMLLMASAWAQPTVSNIRTDGLSHSVVRATWDLSGSAGFHRLRYGTTTSYEGSTYGGIQPGTGNGSASSDVQVALSGLHAATLYHLCPQSSTDNATWSTCVDTTITTSALPSPHPSVPTLPQTFDISMPNMTGATVTRVASDCSDLSTKWATAETARLTGPSVLVLPANCNLTDYDSPITPSDAKTFLGADVNTSTNTITTISHGMANDDPIRFGSLMHNGAPPSGIEQSVWYYACNITTNTYQVCTGTGGSGVVSLVTTGASGQLVIDMAKQSTFWTLVVPEWPLGTVFTAPSNTRVTPSAAFAKWTLNTLGTSHSAFSLQHGIHHHRFIGLEVTTTATAEDPATTVDPTPYGQIGTITSDADHIILDRSYVHGQGYPSRITQGIYSQGSNIAFINSEISGLDSWRGAVKDTTGLAPSVTSTTLTISPGIYMLGYQNCTLASSATAAITSGSASGTYIAYFGMDCTLHVVAPTGISATCTNCTFSTSASPTYPVNGSGNLAAGRVATGTITSGAFASTSNYSPSNVPSSSYQNENPTGVLLLCGGGHGTNMFINNKLEAGNITVHVEDSCNAAQFQNSGLNLTFQRNLFTIRNAWIPTHASFDNRLRPWRNHLECKKCNVMLMDGNIFENVFAGVDPQAYAITMFQTKSASNFRGVVGTAITDLTITNNIIRNSSSGVQIVGGITGAPGVPPPMLRVKVANNFIQTTSAMYDPAFRTNGGLLGLPFQSWGAIEDLSFTHNTVLAQGVGPSLYYDIDALAEGFVVNNNIAAIEDPLGRLGISIEINGSYPITPTCMTSGLTGFAALSCLSVNGAGNASPTFAGNVLVPWNNANASNWLSGWAGATLSTVECGGNCATSTPAQRIAGVGFTDFAGDNYALAGASAYHNAATDGKNPGVDWVALAAAQGGQGATASTPTSTGITMRGASIR